MNRSICVLLLFLLAGGLSFGQTPDLKSKFISAEEHRKNYRFEEAIAIYQQLLEISNDDIFNRTLESRIANCENGLKMLEYAARPKVLSAVDVPIKDFFLYYPDIPDSTWILVPYILNKNIGNYPINNVMRLAPNNDVMYFSVQGKDGKWDIFSSRLIDNVKWSSPEPVNTLNSQEDEILPYLSKDSKKLYFSSNGLAGMGGFDIYVSYWDEKRNMWDTPQNLGFPYSSPADDYLYVETDGGDYAVFASNRNCASPDSITIYILSFEANPVRSPVQSVEEAAQIASLSTSSYLKANNHGTPADTLKKDTETNEYTRMIKDARQLQKEIDENIRAINSNRALLATLNNEDDRNYLIKKIGEDEMILLEKQSKLMSANKAIQQKEMDFLNKGVIIPRQEEMWDKPLIISNQAEQFEVKLSHYGKLPYIEIVEPVKPVDLSFKTSGNFVLIENEQEIPEELFYTIQLFMLSAKADSASFKGISPIFETKTQTGKFNYTAGRFYSYKELSDALQKLKSMGFRDVLPIAYYKGKIISIKNARLLEDKIITDASYQIKITAFPDGIPQYVLELIRNNTEKDIAMKSVAGKSVYYIGPFNGRSEADSLVSILKEVTGEEISVEAIEKK
jgi:hypothetical protein